MDGSANVNDVIIAEGKDGVNQIRFADNKLTSSKNIELSKLAPSMGVFMRISWENSKASVIYPGMPVKVLYLKNNAVKSMVGTVTGKETANYPIQQSYPAKKFSALTFIEVFVSDEQDDSKVQSGSIGKVSLLDSMSFLNG